MMSLSDKVESDFKPIDISTLKSFDEEKNNRGKDSEPDWDRFKAFAEELVSEPKETDLFQDLFDLGNDSKEEEKIVFEQMGEDKKGTKASEEIDLNSETDRNSDHGTNHHKQGDLSNDADVPDLEGVQNIVKDVDSDNKEDQNQDQDDDETGLSQVEKDGYEKGFEQGKKEGTEKGYSEGYEKAEKQAQKDVDVKFTEKIEEFDKMLLKLDNTYDELATRYEDKILSLICLIAEKVVLAKVEMDEEIVKESVLDALKTLPDPEDIILSVSEEDYEYIEMIKEDFFESIKRLKSVSVNSDASVKRGGCRIETKEGYIEVDIETKLAKIFSSIKGRV